MGILKYFLSQNLDKSRDKSILILVGSYTSDINLSIISMHLIRHALEKVRQILFLLNLGKIKKQIRCSFITLGQYKDPCTVQCEL